MGILQETNMSSFMENYLVLEYEASMNLLLDL